MQFINSIERPMDARISEPFSLWIKLAFTLWMLFWVPVVLQAQGPQNFWWLCNVAQFLLLIGLWTNSRLLISSQASTVIVVGVVWTPDFLLGLLLGGSPTGTTAYMFNVDYPLIQRVTSTYHIWLPAFVFWLCWRYGYDRRGMNLQWLIGTLVIIGSWWFGESERNLNYVYAPFGIEQVWLPDWAWIPLLCLLTGVLVYLPGHFLLRWVAGRAE